MKIQPKIEKSHFFDEDETDPSYVDGVFQCCDSVIAVLTQDQIDEWLVLFDEIATAEDAAEYCSYGTTTQVFDIDGALLVTVSDSGGELAAGEFQVWCEENGIEFQPVIDGLYCTGDSVEDIYTGTGGDDNMELLTLLHRIFN